MAVAVRPPEIRSPGVGSAARPVERWTPLGAVLALLPAAALVEVALERVFYRIGVYLPRSGPFGTVYTAFTAVGSLAFNLSSVLAVVALGLLAVTAWRRGRPRMTLALGAFLASSLVLVLAGTETLGPTARLTFVLAVAALALPFVRGTADRWHRAAVALVAACFLCSASAGLIGDGARLVWTQPVGVTAWQVAAEVLVVAAAFGLFAAWIATDGLRVGPLVVAAPLAATLLVAWQANGAVTGILVLWTAGLRLFLPAWLYALALWAFLAAAIGWLRRHPVRSGGLVLLLAAGMLLGNTYLQALGLVALAMLSDGAAVGGLPELRRPAS